VRKRSGPRGRVIGVSRGKEVIQVRGVGRYWGKDPKPSRSLNTFRATDEERAATSENTTPLETKTLPVSFPVGVELARKNGNQTNKGQERCGLRKR